MRITAFPSAASPPWPAAAPYKSPPLPGLVSAHPPLFPSLPHAFVCFSIFLVLRTLFLSRFTKSRRCPSASPPACSPSLSSSPSSAARARRPPRRTSTRTSPRTTRPGRSTALRPSGGTRPSPTPHRHGWTSASSNTRAGPSGHTERTSRLALGAATTSRLRSSPGPMKARNTTDRTRSRRTSRRSCGRAANSSGAPFRSARAFSPQNTGLQSILRASTSRRGTSSGNFRKMCRLERRLVSSKRRRLGVAQTFCYISFVLVTHQECTTCREIHYITALSPIPFLPKPYNAHDCSDSTNIRENSISKRTRRFSESL